MGLFENLFRRKAPVRLPTLKQDFWELRSGEESHRKSPITFQIPSRDARANLRRGQAAKLIFEIEATDETGAIVVGGERMWVIMTERVAEVYLGVLVDEPSLDPSDDVYLREGAEIPFLPEHIIDIDDPPDDFVAQVFAREPTRRWPR
jgi:hypothetical protein